MKRSVLFLVLLALACSTTHQYTSRPGPKGVIEGVVVDHDALPLPGVTVIVEAPGVAARTLYTDANGKYAFTGLPPGTYTMTIELAGFNRRKQTVVVQQEQGVSLITELPFAAISETITVTASAPFGWGGVFSSNSGGGEEIELPEPQYASLPENGFVDVQKENVATFAIDVDRASYANVRRFLNQGSLPPADAVRIEEMINYFTYAYPQPQSDAPFSITTEVAGCPWNTSHRLLRVGIQGRNLEQWRMAPNNLVFLIDVSGSMSSPDKLALIKDAFRVLVDGLRVEDRVAIVVYAGAAGLVLPSTSGADKQTIIDAIARLEAGGSTAGGEGIELAYAVAQQNFREDGNNRVILATDGDFNVGVSSARGLEKLIEKKRRSGIFLSVIGVGTDDFQDAKMEMLADKGNGNFAYLDSLQEAEKVFRSELTGTLVTIAKDVKVQLEFDPRAVASYRQIGYENRALSKKDFDDDEKDAGELGAGHSVTALFEIVPASPTCGRFATLRLRYKEPKGSMSKPLIAEVVDDGRSAYEASPDMQFAAAVAELGMLLRDSKHKGNATWDDVFQLAKVAQGADLDGTRGEFVKLVARAKSLK